MGRKKKYKDSATKTSTAQKEAAKAYYSRNKDKSKTISITQTAEQTAADKVTLKAHGLKPLQFWRLSIERLNAEPLPELPDKQKPD